jgi:ABC-type glutathione transport system ATPase component
MKGMPVAEHILVARDLCRSYPGRRTADRVRAVNGIDLSLAPGEAVGIVGESGSGKSTLARLLLALERPDRGSVIFEDHPISQLSEARLRPLRRGFQAVFQDPSTSLDPCLRVETIIAEPLAAHRIGDRSQRRTRVTDLLAQVGLPADAGQWRPNAFSGGDRQRIAIARALAPEPRLLILDEPVSSLDLSVQAQILDLITDLRHQHRLSLIMISHDIEVVREVCERIAVMHHGSFVETGRTTEVLEHPQHPYTRMLLDAAPHV